MSRKRVQLVEDSYECPAHQLATTAVVLLASATILFAHEASAQSCSHANDGWENGAGHLMITASDCFGDTDFIAHLASAKGAFTNAMVFDVPYVGGRVCSDLNQGEASCLAYTGGCAACGNDPNAPGQVSCFCHGDQQSGSPVVFEPMALSTAPRGTTQDFRSRLLTDTDNDGIHDKFYYSAWAANPNGTRQVRSYKLAPDLYRLDWEDLYEGGDGDFDDYIAMVEARTCEKHEFPIESKGDEGLSCFINCATTEYYNPVTNTAECPSGILRYGDLHYTVAIGIDDDESSFDREHGRTLHVTVATYWDSAIQRGRRMVVCPQLDIEPEDPSMDPADKVMEVSYGLETDGSCAENGDLTTTGSCGVYRDHKDSLYSASGWFPISLAREQHYSPHSCSMPRTGIGDVFETPGALACGGQYAGTHVESYQLNLADVDAELSTSNDRLDGATAPRILERIKGVQLSIIQDPPRDFHCPSGVNVNFYSVDVSEHGILQYAYLKNGYNNFRTYIRE